MAFDRRNSPAVEVVYVTAKLQLTGAVNEGRLVGEVNPDRCCKLNVLFSAAEHVLDFLRRPPLVWPRNVEENFSVFGRILYAHAAMTVSADLMPKQLLVRRIVLINREPVRKIESNPS